MIIFLNDHYIEEDKATIPINDRGFLFGDGVFTTMRLSNGLVEFLPEHLQRLQDQCEKLNIISPHIDPSWISDLIKRNHAEKGVWRLKIIITGGTSPHLHLPKRKHGQLLMTLHPYEINDLPRKLIVLETPHSSFLQMKSLSYLERLWIKEKAQSQGSDDAIVCDHQGNILETAFSNIFWRRNSTIYTPDPNLGLLEGISLKNLMKCLQNMNFNLQFVKQQWSDFPKDVQVYTINCMTRIVPVVKINEIDFSRDLIFEKLTLPQQLQELV